METLNDLRNQAAEELEKDEETLKCYKELYRKKLKEQKILADLRRQDENLEFELRTIKLNLKNIITNTKILKSIIRRLNNIEKTYKDGE